MKINKITSTNFMAHTKQVSSQIKKGTGNAVTNVCNRETFYKQIDKYMRGKYSQKEYLKHFTNNIQNIKDANEFTNIEKKYINDLIVTMDMTEDFSKIPDEYLRYRMKQLLEQLDK